MNRDIAVQNPFVGLRPFESKTAFTISGARNKPTPY